jgi:hypothetical protein
MTAIQQSPTEIAAAATTARYRAAAEAHDVEGVISTLSKDVVLHSPITERIGFEGHAEMRELLGAVFESLSEIRYTSDVGDDRTRALFVRAKVGGQPVEEAMRIVLDDKAEITEITLFFRPLPGLAALAHELAPRVVGRRHGRTRATLAQLLMAPLALLTRIGDFFIPWFA